MAVRDPFFADTSRDVPLRPGRAARRGELLFVAVAALLLALPFLGKAVSQDDWAYLEVAGRIGQHGLVDAWTQETVYQGLPISAGEGVLHGPVWMLLLRGALALPFGLYPAHLLSVLCLVLLAVATCSLAARFGAAPVPTALALALSPAPLLLAGGLMTDLPMLAFFTASLALCVRGMRTAELAPLLGAACFALLAALTRFHALPCVLAMLLVAPLLLGGRGVRAYLPFLATAVGLGAYLAWSSSAVGELDPLRGARVLAEARRIQGSRTVEALLAALCALGGVGVGWWIGALTAPRAALSAAFGDSTRGVLLFCAAIVAVLLGFEARGGAPTGIDTAGRALQGLFFTLGAAAALLSLVPFLDASRLVRGGVRGWLSRRGADAWLACWLLGMLIVASRFVPFGATRYAVPCLPPLFLLGGMFAARHLPRRVPWAALAASAVLGIVCATADWRAADAHRAFAMEVAERREPGGEWEQGELWIHGELGFRWYLEREVGGRVLSSDSLAPRAGDRVLRSATCTDAQDDGSAGTYRLHPNLSRRLVHEGLDTLGDPYPVRVHNHFAGAGFYGAAAGYLPFALRSVPHDVVQTWGVRAENWFFARAAEAQLETEPALELPGEGLVTGRIDLRRAHVAPDEHGLQALVFLLPGRATWTRAIPEGGVLRTRVGELQRNWDPDGDPLPGPGAAVRVSVDGEVVAELELDSRRREEDRGWKDLEVDLSRFGGRTVALTLEADARRPPPAGLDPAFERFVFVAVAGPEVTGS